MKPQITLGELTKDNWKAVVNLKVRDDQMDFVASNVYTIAETRFHPWARLRVIHANNRLVGFAAYGVDPELRELWLHRFMIGAEFQGRGYGRAALQALIAEWESDYPAIQEVLLSYEPVNTYAERLYVSEGFVPGEIAEWGERFARRPLHGRE